MEILINIGIPLWLSVK